ncbi:chorismate synthase [Candidatus Neomarinimicrobiota bacterium]
MMEKLKFLTAGESHGKQLTGIIDGIPAGLKLSEDYIADQLIRRQLGHGRGKRMLIEQDRAEICSGVRFGKTIGSPITLVIPNKDWDNWKNKMSVGPSAVKTKAVTVPRPGHADLVGVEKYGFHDIRNILERSSARETAMRVGLGSIARRLLEEIGITVGSHVVQIHKIKILKSVTDNIKPPEINRKADKSHVRCLDQSVEEMMIETIDHAKKNGDSVGGVFDVIADGLPYGLGSYVHWNKKLHARISAAILSINAIKGIEFGEGFASASSFGSELHDEIEYRDNKFTRLSNNAGGIEGGMSNAQRIVFSAVMKPIPTLTRPLRSVDLKTHKVVDAHKERTDTCAVPAASIIAESMLCMVLADAVLEKFGGDSMNQLKAHMNATAKY